MRLSALGLFGVALMLCAIEPAAARDGCGPGRYWNGYRCVSYGGYGGGYYGYYRPRPYSAPPGPGDWGPQTTYYRDCYNYYGRRICCPKYWTVQDGVCRPYRGY